MKKVKMKTECKESYYWYIADNSEFEIPLSPIFDTVEELTEYINKTAYKEERKTVRQVYFAGRSNNIRNENVDRMNRITEGKHRPRWKGTFHIVKVRCLD